MGSFFAALTTVGVMLFYAVPGFWLVKSKLVASDSISAFAKLLMYVCSPMLVIYSFVNIEFSWELTGKMGIAFVFAISVMVVFALITTGAPSLSDSNAASITFITLMS